MRPDILAHKLHQHNLPSHIVKLVLSFLSDRNQCVKLSDKTSAVLLTKLSGPALWNIYVSSLQSGSNIIKYADDTTLYSKINKYELNITHQAGCEQTVNIPNNALQHAANEVAQWSIDNPQRLNASKTQYMLFTLQLNTCVDSPILINNEAVSQENEAKLLGVDLGSHLTVANHVEKCIEKSPSAVHGLLTLKRRGVQSDVG